MKYHDYTANTGDHTTHDTSASVSAEALEHVREMLRAGSGEVARTGCRYEYRPDPPVLVTRIDDRVIWASLFFRDDNEAESALSSTRDFMLYLGMPEFGSPVESLPDRLQSPGLITLLHPGAMRAKEHLTMLGDFCHCCAAVVILDF